MRTLGIPEKFRPHFYESTVYHAYNRTNNAEILFKDDQDYEVFQWRIKKYILPICDIFCFCLIPNHFHLVLRIKTIENLVKIVEEIPIRKRTKTQLSFLKFKDEVAVNDLIGQCFSNMMVSYAKYFNRKYLRKGNLFNKCLKRTVVDTEEYLDRVIYYVHTNPVKHGIVLDYENYAWSSMAELRAKYEFIVNKDLLYAVFGGKEGLLRHHHGTHKLKPVRNLLLE